MQRHPGPPGRVGDGQVRRELVPWQGQRGMNLIRDHQDVVPGGQLGELGQLSRWNQTAHRIVWVAQDIAPDPVGECPLQSG